MTPKKISVDNLKSNFDEILRCVATGESFTITISDKPVADLMPACTSHKGDLQSVIDGMLALQKTVATSDQELAVFREDGRR